MSSLPRPRFLLLAVLVVALLTPAAGAGARGSLLSILEEDPGMQSDPYGTMQQLRMLGAQATRMPIRWWTVAPAGPRRHPYSRPAHFNAADPNARGYQWSTLDSIDRAAAAYGIQVDFDIIGGAPLWATGKGAPGQTNWEPNAAEYLQFVEAVGKRYSGHFLPRGSSTPLPRVTIWSIWNEPDYGPSLAPQGLPGHLSIDYSPQMYRNLVDAGWKGLQRTGHGPDTILFGEVAPRGYDHWGTYSGMRPLYFLRSMYCVDSGYRPLRGSAARVRGCPTTAAGTRRFRTDHPALFQATGFADHPYMRWYAPNHEQNPDPVTHKPTADYSTLGTISAFERGLDRLQRVYGSHRRLPIYDTEFGYLTVPPKRHDQYPWVSQTTAAYYLNWAEYIHWRDPRLASYTQYLLKDPLPTLKSNDYGGYASGLLTYGGRPKPGYYAWRMPLFLPVTSTRRGRSLEVWGCARPAPSTAVQGLTATAVEVQAGPGGNPASSAYQTVASVPVSSTGCYFDLRIKFPGSGLETVRLRWRYPALDPLGYIDPAHLNGVIYSRHVQIRLR